MNHNSDTFLTINNHKLHYQVIGEGKPLILLHGFPSPITPNHLFVQSLKDHYQMYLVDLPGFGQSERLSSFCLDHYVETIRTLITTLDLHKPYLLGFSMGGIIALKYATLYSHSIEKMVICASSASFKQCDTALKLLLSLFISTEKIPFTQKHIHALHNDPDRILAWWKKIEPSADTTNQEIKQTLDDLIKLDVNFIYEFAKWIKKLDFHPECQKIKTPTLFVAGSKDRLMTAQAVKKTHQTIAQSKFIVNPGKEHFNILDATMIKQIDHFLEGQTHEHH